MSAQLTSLLIGAVIFLIVASPFAYWTTGKAASLLNTKVGLKVAVLVSLTGWIALDAIMSNVNAALSSAPDGYALFRAEEISVFAIAHVLAYVWRLAHVSKSKLVQ